MTHRRGEPVDAALQQERRSKFDCRGGWTAIELLASLALAGLLAAATLGITGKLAVELATIRRTAPVHPWTSVLECQLQREYQTCRAVRVSRDFMVFDGYFRSASGEEGTRHGPIRVEYRIESNGGRLYLQRTQFDLDTPLQDATSVSMVAVGIRGIELKTRLDTDAPPGVLRVALWSETDPTEPALDMVLVRHGVAR